MAEPIAPSTRITEIAATARSVRLSPGQFSRVMPRNDTVTAQRASSTPMTWKAFTGANANASCGAERPRGCACEEAALARGCREDRGAADAA